jgi:hypothetical protein
MSDKKTKLAQGDDRSQKTVNVQGPGRAQRARKAGPHGAQTDSAGNNNALPKNHSKTKDLTLAGGGGKPGLNLKS